MYILVKITSRNKVNQSYSIEKSRIVTYLTKKGYYWSETHNRYIHNDSATMGSNVCDYIIEKVEPLEKEPFDVEKLRQVQTWLAENGLGYSLDELKAMVELNTLDINAEQPSYIAEFKKYLEIK